MILLQTQLTDEMITQALEENTPSVLPLYWLLGGIAVFFIILTILYTAVKKIIRRKCTTEQTMHTILRFWRIFITFFVGVGVTATVFIVFVLLNGNVQQHPDVWLIRLTEITDIEKDAQVLHKDDPARNETRIHTFAQFEGIPNYHGVEKEYSVGDAVYVVINEHGDVAAVYDAEEYEYIGDRLQ